MAGLRIRGIFATIFFPNPTMRQAMTRLPRELSQQSESAGERRLVVRKKEIKFKKLLTLPNIAKSSRKRVCCGFLYVVNQ